MRCFKQAQAATEHSHVSTMPHTSSKATENMKSSYVRLEGSPNAHLPSNRLQNTLALARATQTQQRGHKHSKDINHKRNHNHNNNKK